MRCDEAVKRPIAQKQAAMMQGGKLILTDEKGETLTVTIANVIQSNCVISFDGSTNSQLKPMLAGD
jgi:hypothetical protein